MKWTTLKSILTNATMLTTTVSLFLYLCIFSISTKAQQPSSLILNNSQTRYQLENQLEYFIDPANEASIHRIINGDYDDDFIPTNTSAPNFGFSQKPVWLKFSINNPLDIQKKLLLEINYALINEIRLYYQLSDGQLKNIITGLNHPYYSRPIDYIYYIFPINIPHKSTVTYYMYVQSESPYSIPMSVSTYLDSAKRQGITLLTLGLYFGLLVVMMSYNFFLAISVIDKSYFYYVAFIFSISCFQLASFGLGYQFWPEQSWWNLQLRTLGGTGTTFFAILFGRAFLDTKRYTRYWDKIMIVSLYSSIICTFVTLVFGYKYSSLLLTFVVLFASTVQIIAGIIRLRQGYKPARYFLLAWSMLILGSLVFQLWSFGLVEYSEFAIRSLIIGSSLEAVLLSFALAYRINLLKTEKVESMQAAADARAQSEAKSDFLAKMSHEIRTPMNGVLGMVELLRDTKLEPIQKHYANVIHNSGKVLLNVINDILDYSKIESGKIELEHIPFNLEQLIDESISVFTSTASSKKIEFIGYIKPNTPIALKGDPTRIRQIILNLLSNSFKFTEDGEIIISAFLNGYSNSNQPIIRIEVKDTGIGIDSKQQETLFQSFSQADTSITRKYGGTGLGLTISKQLVEMMHGEIGLISMTGKGSLFWFTLVLDKANSNELSIPILRFDEFKYKRLLIINEHIAFCDILQEYTQFWKMNVAVAYTGKDGMEQLEKKLQLREPYDLIIINNDLPDTTGLAFVELLRSKYKSIKTAIILVADANELPSKKTTNKLNINIVLENPITHHHLYSSLHNIFDNKKETLASNKETIRNSTEKDNLKHLSVLIAEDNEVNQLVVKGLLAKLCIKPIIVNNGKEAVNIFETTKKQFDVILMDCEMPELDGYRATKIIRDIEKKHNKKRTAIVALTAHAMQEHREKSVAAGMDDHLTKPLSIIDLKTILIKWGIDN